MVLGLDPRTLGIAGHELCFVCPALSIPLHLRSVPFVFRLTLSWKYCSIPVIKSIDWEFAKLASSLGSDKYCDMLLT